MIPIVKIKGLPLSAKSKDIRALFSGLLIPDGAVHIIGGPEALAFIAFGTFEDAKQAVMYSHAEIHGCPIAVEWSAETEMCQVIGEILRARNANIHSNDFKGHVSSSSGNHVEHLPESTSKRSRTDTPAFGSSKQIEVLSEDAVSCYKEKNYFTFGSSLDLQSYVTQSALARQDDVHPENPYYQQQVCPNVFQSNEHTVLAQSPLPGTMTKKPIKREQSEKQKSYYIKLSSLPTEVSTTAALEDFLDPSIPLRLSSVKTIFDRNRFPYCFLVRLENVDDMQNALNKDGEKGIKIQGCSQAYFVNAIDGSIKKPKAEGAKVDGYSSEEEIQFSKRETSSKRIMPERLKISVQTSRSRSPQTGSKHSEPKRFERGRSPDQRRSELNGSRKRKERCNDRDRHGDYDRFSPTKHRWRKPSPKKSDRSPSSKRQEKEQERVSTQGHLFSKESHRQGSNEKGVSSAKADKPGLQENCLQGSFLLNEKNASQEAASGVPPCALGSCLVSPKRQGHVSPRATPDSDSLTSVDNPCCTPTRNTVNAKCSDSHGTMENSVPCKESTIVTSFKLKMATRNLSTTDGLGLKSKKEVPEIMESSNNRLNSEVPFPINNSDNSKEVKQVLSTGADKRYCVEFTNLPLSVTEDEVKDYLGSLCSNATVRRACFRDGKPSDRWIAVFKTEELAQKACHLSGEIQGQIIIPRKLVEQEAALLLEGAKQVGGNLTEPIQNKIKFSIVKDKQPGKSKQDKENSVSNQIVASVASSKPVKSESEEVMEAEGTEEFVHGESVTNEVNAGYQGAPYGSRNEQLWHLYNQYCQTYYAATNGPIDYMQTALHGVHGNRGRPVLIPNGPAEFCAPYQYVGTCFPSTVPQDNSADQMSFFGAMHTSKYLQRGVPARFRTPVTYSANPLLYKRRGAGGYEAKGLLNTEKPPLSDSKSSETSVAVKTAEGSLVTTGTNSAEKEEIKAN